MQPPTTFAVFQAGPTVKRSGDFLQFPPRIANPKYVDTKSPWEW